MTKTLRKAIMRRTQLHTKYFKTKTQKDYASFKKKQRNFCSKFYKKERRIYYENLDMKNVTDNTIFPKTAEQFFWNKINRPTKISLKKNDRILSEDHMVAKEWSSFFENVVKGALSGLRQFLATENPLKWWKMLFISP